MSQILVDSSVWIAFFRGSIPKEPLFELIDANQLCTNDLILSEIVPSLVVRKQKELVATLHRIQRYSLSIDWHDLIEFQVRNLRKGINKVGVPDLIIIQNVIQNNLILYTKDAHFTKMAEIFPFKLYDR